MNGLIDEIRIALFGVWQRRWLALAVAWGVCVLGWLVVALIPNSYESKARVSIQARETLTSQVGITAAEQRRSLEQMQQTLTSVVNMEKVVRGTDLSIGADSDAAVRGRAAGLVTAIKVETQQDGIFTITTKQGSPKLAQDVTQKVIDIFQEENIAGGRDETRDTLRFLDTQLADRQKALASAEQKRAEFESKNIGLLPGIGSPSQRLEQARIELNQIDSQLISARSALSALNGQLAGTPATISTPGLGGGGNPALSQAMGEMAAMRSRGYTDAHPDMIAIKQQIALLRQQGGGGGGGAYATPNPAYAPLQSMRAERQAAVVALETRKAQLSGEMTAMMAKQIQEPEIAAEYQRVSRDYEVQKAGYDKLLADREAVRMRGQAESQGDAIQFKVVDPPSTSRAPVAPNRPLLLAGVLILGIGAGAGVAFAMGQLRASFPTASRLEKVSGMPVIGSISQIVGDAERSERKRKMKFFYGGVGALVGMFGLLLVAEFVSRSMVA